MSKVAVTKKSFAYSRNRDENRRSNSFNRRSALRKSQDDDEDEEEDDSQPSNPFKTASERLVSFVIRLQPSTKTDKCLRKKMKESV